MNYMQLNSLAQSRALQFLSFLICVSILSPFVLGQTRDTKAIESTTVSSSLLAVPIPVSFPGSGNTTCADLNASTNPAFAHIEEDWELKYDSTPPLAPGSTHTFSTGGGWFLGGGAPTDLTRTVTIVGRRSGTNGENIDLLDWRSTRRITAVIVKAQGSLVYPYNPASFGFVDGIGLTTVAGSQISHVTFCFQESGGPTAGDGSISGRVVNSYGIGISNARMSLVDASTGETVTALTNGFGYYTIDNIAVGEFYVLNIEHKRYRFAESSKAFSLSDSVANVDFVANP